MSNKDFPPRSGHPKDDPESLIRWLDKLQQRQNIDDQIELTTPALGDEVGIFDISAGVFRKATLTNTLALATGGGMTLGTPVAATSGTSIDFTGIPSTAKLIAINVSLVSTDNTSPFLIQIGDSGGIENAGYDGGGVDFLGATGAGYTAGFGLGTAQTAIRAYSGTILLIKENTSAFTWCCIGMIGRVNDGNMYFTAGTKSTSAALDRVRITTAGGTANFDAGEVNIGYL